ncbi:hypothetical protein [Symmachiella dynata]|nr:hypothetical protein [Symmachiella dynata]
MSHSPRSAARTLMGPAFDILYRTIEQLLLFVSFFGFLIGHRQFGETVSADNYLWQEFTVKQFERRFQIRFVCANHPVTNRLLVEITALSLFVMFGQRGNNLSQGFAFIGAFLCFGVAGFPIRHRFNLHNRLG